MNLSRTACLLLSGALALSGAPALAADAADPLSLLLQESRDKARGVTLHVQGQSIGMAVTEIKDGYVIGRSQQSSRIVVRLDRIDAVSSAF